VSAVPAASPRQPARVLGWLAPDGPRFAGIHLPAGPARGDVLMVPGRTQNRCGPHRLYVKLAWRLAAAGYRVVRLDPSGLGDSAGRCDPIAMRGDVADALTRLRPESATYLLGLCEGAALARAAAGADLAGLILLAPLESERRRDDRLYFGSVFKRLWRPATWRGLRALGAGSVARFGADRLTRLMRSGSRPFRSPAAPPGCPTLIVRAGADPYAPDPAPNESSWGRTASAAVEEALIAGADHTFAGSDWEQALGDTVLGWIQRRPRAAARSIGLPDLGAPLSEGPAGLAVEYTPGRCAFWHRPIGPIRGAILLLAPLAEEARWSRAVLRAAALQFAAAGYAVLRPDLSGHGDSPEEFDRCTVAGWGAEVRAAESYLAARAPAAPVVVGLRFGALLGWSSAARATRHVMWDPPPSAIAHLRHYLRIKGLQELFLLGRPRAGAAELERRLALGETIDVAGYRFSPELWRGARQLDAELGRCFPPRSVSVLLNRGALLPAWLAAERPRLRSMKLPRFWELHGRQSVPELAEQTIRWLEDS